MAGIIAFDYASKPLLFSSRQESNSCIVLREVAERVNKVVRPYDFVGRYGGEEFVVVLSACSRQDVMPSAERIRAAISSSPIACGDAEFRVTVSVGAAVTAPGDSSEQQILARADAALYAAKRNGRNRVEFVGEEAEAKRLPGRTWPKTAEKCSR